MTIHVDYISNEHSHRATHKYPAAETYRVEGGVLTVTGSGGWLGSYPPGSWAAVYKPEELTGATDDTAAE